MKNTHSVSLLHKFTALFLATLIALPHFAVAVAAEQKTIGAFANSAVAHYRKGEYDKAIADINKVIASDPKNAYAYNIRGNAYYMKGEYDTAMSNYTKAIELKPTMALYHNNRGNCYYAKGDRDKAIDDYSRAIDIDPKFGMAYINRGQCRADKGFYFTAIADFDEAIKVDPQNAHHARAEREKAERNRIAQEQNTKAIGNAKDTGGSAAGIAIVGALTVVGGFLWYLATGEEKK